MSHKTGHSFNYDIFETCGSITFSFSTLKYNVLQLYNKQKQGSYCPTQGTMVCRKCNRTSTSAVAVTCPMIMYDMRPMTSEWPEKITEGSDMTASSSSRQSVDVVTRS